MSTETTRARQLRITINRAKRLIRFCKLDAPDYILGKEADLVLRGVMALGEYAAKGFMENLIEDAKRGAALCAYPGGCMDNIPPEQILNTYGIYCEKHEHEMQEMADVIDDEEDEARPSEPPAKDSAEESAK